LLKNKIIVVTGGAGLIGTGFIKAIVKNNGTAIIADINKNVGLELKSNLEKLLDSKNIDFVKLDINSKESLLNCISELSQKYKRIDALVNNAYPRNDAYGNHFFDINYSDFIDNLNLNLGGYFLASQQFAEFFMSQGYGNIINMSSIYGVVTPKFDVYRDTPMTMPVEYAVIKSGLIHLTKYMAKYFKGSKIRVNSISPGGIFNNQPKSFIKNYNKFGLNKGMLDVNDICGTLIFLLSEHSANINGQNIIVDDGWSL
tara:strand:- start:556 stop:1326 length:771 start_codon:yes stop_codon:yes gene_type:complete